MHVENCVSAHEMKILICGVQEGLVEALGTVYCSPLNLELSLMRVVRGLGDSLETLLTEHCCF